MAQSSLPARPSVGGVIYNAVRGGMIGLAELIPGVSGGTIALITGVYERVLTAGNHLLGAIKALVVGPDRKRGFADGMRRVDWWLLIPMLVGMAAMVLSLAGVMESFVTDTPTLSRGLFLGMVAASVVVPLVMVDWAGVQRRHVWIHVLGFVVAAGVAFWLTSSGAGAEVANPPLWMVFCAAAVAVCALALPGVSGSFFLLVVGLYAPTMGAIADRDLVYIAVFGLGAVTGLALFIKLLHWLLGHHHTGTMFAMSGLLLGSLRALWPWQSDEGALLAPGSDAGVVFLLAVVGAVVVLALVVMDRVLSRPQTVSAEGERLPVEN